MPCFLSRKKGAMLSKISKRDSNLSKRILTRNPNQLLLSPYIITSIVGNNSYLLKDMDGQLFSYTTNGSHVNHYVEPG